MQSAIDSTIAAGLIGALTPKKTMLTATTKASVTTIKQVCTTICAASTQYAGTGVVEMISSRLRASCVSAAYTRAVRSSSIEKS